MAAACAVACVLFIAAGPPATAASQELYAVLAVDEAQGASAERTLAADSVRAALRQQGAAVLDQKTTVERMHEQAIAVGFDITVLRKRLDAAEAAFTALDQQGSVRLLEGVINDLAVDPEFSTEKQELLETARLRLVSRLIGLAGAKETGEGETAEGQRALTALVEAVRANPDLKLPEGQFPPRARKLLPKASDALRKIERGRLEVTSRPTRADVWVEGRVVGKTPLTLENVLARGKYRLWVSAGEGKTAARSITRVVDVQPKSPPLFVDLAFEGALWPDGPGLRPIAGNSIDEDVAKKIGRFLDVKHLLLVGIAEYENERWLYGAAFSVQEGTTARRGAVRLSPEMPVQTAAVNLAHFLGTGQGDVEVRPVPASVLPERPKDASSSAQAPLDGGRPVLSSTTTVANADEGLPVVPVAIAGGAAGAVLLGAGIALAVVLWPREQVPTVLIGVEVEQ